MDERIDLSMSDPDLVPLLIQVYIFCILVGLLSQISWNGKLFPATSDSSDF